LTQAANATNLASSVKELSFEILEDPLKLEAEAKATAEAAAKAAAELKAKQEAEAKAKVPAALKKTTMTCVKGKLSKKVTAVNPKCPSGYKVKS
jgi:membrane protein involved in colicin uptake